MEITLLNKKSNSIINKEKIILSNDSGILISNGNCWKYVPQEDIVQQNDYTSKYYYLNDKPKYIETAVSSQFHIDNIDVQEAYTEKAQYHFGFKNLQCSTKYLIKNSFIVSKDIEIDKCDYITLFTEEYKYNSDIEYYIIDGINEIPILPIDNNKIFKEKLFYGISTRFRIDPANPIIIYENNIEKDRNRDQLSAEEYEKNTYTISYTPYGDVHKYIPQNSKIKLKIIFRCYDESESVAEIKKIMINKYGGI